MKKIAVLIFGCFLATNAVAQAGQNGREMWLNYMDKMARPVLLNLAENTLKETMPVELAKNTDNAVSRKSVSYLEAFGRTLSGIAPWLNLEGGSKYETSLRNEYRKLSLKAIANAVNPNAKDYLQWNGGQPLVDASFFALGLIRCPWLWQHLDTAVKLQVVTALKTTRTTVPVYSNWILFTGMIEAFFCKYGYEFDAVRIEFGIREFANHWYVGDGMFSDGMHFNMDYYNSIVIHPYLQTIVETVNKKNRAYEGFALSLDKIHKRYAEIQERNINTDGSYPIIGRSIAYRGGVFHHLANMAFTKQLPVSIKPAQVRSALIAVIKKTMDGSSTYNSNGWLNIGVAGSQPGLGEFYITTGSLYLCSNIFLPLGLSETDEFWSAPAEPWTSVKVWSGQNLEADHAADIRF